MTETPREALRERVATLMGRLAEGDRSAVDELYGLVWPRLRALCLARLGDEAAAEDAAQEALVKVLREAHRYDPSRDALAWLCAVASWEARTERARRRRRRTGDLPDHAVDPGPAPDARLLEAEEWEALRSAWDELGPRDREAIDHYLSDAGPAGPALRKRKSRALERLAQLVSRRHG